MSLKQRLFPKGFKRTLNRYWAQVADRVTRQDWRRAVERLQTAPGSVICVHSMLSGFGYLAGGPQSVIRGVQDAVPDCTLMMPSFPFSGPVLEYLAGDPVYDPRSAPSQSGALTEVLRTWPGARRSLHPTHPCVALGPRAAELIDGSELSPTPFGDDSTYGRYSRLEDPIMLLLHTHNTSFVHRMQEMVNIPNLFLPEMREVRGLDWDGAERSYRVCVHRSTVPLYVVMEPGVYAWLPDYVLLWPDYNVDRTLGRIPSQACRDLLVKRHEEFLRDGVYRIAPLGKGEVMAVRVRPWQERICADLLETMRRYPEEYSLESMERARAGGLLKH